VIARLLVVATLAVAALRPSVAAATIITLQASAAQTASANSTCISVASIEQAQVVVTVSAVSGTSPQLDLWLESCQDSAGSSAVELVAATVLKSSAVAAANSVSTNVRDIVDAKTSTTAESFTAMYERLPAKYVRVRWAISGTTPSFTFSVYLNGK
jgi:hypothetical protein